MNPLYRILPLLIICFYCFTGQAQTRSISVSLKEESDSVKFVLYNNTKQPFWLFDSYLDPKYGDVLFQSQYLHRFDRKTDQFKLSFLPITPWLSFRYSDLVVRNEKTISYPGQVIYHFRQMPGKDYIEIAIPKEAFSCEEYVIDKPLVEYHKYDLANRVKFRTTARSPQQPYRTVEFAVYQSLEGINENFYYFNEGVFDDAVRGYDILSVTIRTDSWTLADWGPLIEDTLRFCL